MGAPRIGANRIRALMWRFSMASGGSAKIQRIDRKLPSGVANAWERWLCSFWHIWLQGHEPGYTVSWWPQNSWANACLPASKQISKYGTCWFMPPKYVTGWRHVGWFWKSVHYQLNIHIIKSKSTYSPYTLTKIMKIADTHQMCFLSRSSPNETSLPQVHHMLQPDDPSPIQPMHQRPVCFLSWGRSNFVIRYLEYLGIICWNTLGYVIYWYVILGLISSDKQNWS